MTTETLDLAPYSEVKAAIAKMNAESAGLTFDYETPKGNKLALKVMGEVDWHTVNVAIVKRWSEAGLKRIKTMACSD